MERNQSEQQFYLSNLGTQNIISSAQFQCNVIGSNKTINHTMVPNSNNSPLNYNIKYQSPSSDFRIAQNLPSSNAHNCYTAINSQSDELMFLLSNNKSNKKQYVNKRNLNSKFPSPCLNNANSSDITAAPNQLTILVQEVLPAQVPDNPVITKAISSRINPSFIPGKTHSIMTAVQSKDNGDICVEKELGIDKKNVVEFSPKAKDLEIVNFPTPTNLNESIRDTISEVIKEVLMKALSNDPHEDVFLSVIKSRDNEIRPSLDLVDSVEMSSTMSSPVLSHIPDSSVEQLSVNNSTPPYQRSSEQYRSAPRTVETGNFIQPQFLNQTESRGSANINESSKSISLTQSVPKSEFYSSNCKITQNSPVKEDMLLHHNILIGSKINNNKRRNQNVPKSVSKKQKLSEPFYHEKMTIPAHRYQQNMMRQLGVPNFKKLVHEPRIKNNVIVLPPVGCKTRYTFCSDVLQLQDKCAKYKRVPFTMPQINPTHTGCNRSTENSFILQNINVSIPEGVLLSIRDSDDIDCLIPPSPVSTELDYLSIFNCDSIASPAVSLSGPNLEMLHPPNRVQSPQLSVFHCPNKDYLRYDNSDIISPNRTVDCHSFLKNSGISRVQISHKYSSIPTTNRNSDNTLIDSETGEVVSKPVNSTKSPEKLLMTFTITPPDDVEKTVRNITDVLGIDYSSVEFKETMRGGGEITIDSDSIAGNKIPKEISERYNTSMVLNSSVHKSEAKISITRALDNFLSTDKPELVPLYAEKMYKSTALLHRPLQKCSNCDKSLVTNQKNGSTIISVLCDRLKTFRDLWFCDDNCQKQYSQITSVDDDNHSTGANYTNTGYGHHSSGKSGTGDSKDQCIFVGDNLFDASCVIVQGSLSKSKQISRRLGVLINDRLLKRQKTTVVPPPLKSSQKIFKGTKYHSYHSSSLQSDHHTSIISDESFHKLSMKSKTVLRQNGIKDRRLCCLCQRIGDLPENGPGRLLCFDQDKWLHVNCTLWSGNVHEMHSGVLSNVPESLETSLKFVCTVCGKTGAGIACYYPRCTLKYHVSCAQEKGCLFFPDRTVYCQLHQTKDLDPCLTELNVDRRVYISRDELSQISGIINNEDQNFFLRVGSLIVISIGQLLPHQIHSGNFHNLNYVYPTGFKSRRIHWSSRVVNTRSIYECEILMDKDHPLFKVTATDENMDDEYYFGATCMETWKSILNKISNLRKSHKLVKCFPERLKAEDLYGLTEPLVLRAIESLPGLESISDYAFKFGKMQLIVEMPLPINTTGSSRTEPFVKLYHHILHKPAIHQSPTFMRHLMALKQENSMYNKTVLSNKWQQYRKLKFETKLNVVLKRSKIQGFGLYASRDIDKGTMIIEYVGELIRNEIANLREKQYENKKRGVYMFRLDPFTVIDATRAGDLARYINHCCDPNCFTELLDFDKESHIVIISNRKIDKGEELTYDYKFDFDDGKEDKIPCLCGARNCRRWMN